MGATSVSTAPRWGASGIRGAARIMREWSRATTDLQMMRPPGTRRQMMVQVEPALHPLSWPRHCWLVARCLSDKDVLSNTRSGGCRGERIEAGGSHSMTVGSVGQNVVS